MEKILLISFVFAPIVLPIVAAKDPSPVRGMRRALLWWVVFNAGYLMFYRFVWTRLL